MAPMQSLTQSDIERMTGALFIDQPFRGLQASKFWTLLALSAVIATAGVIADSTATVIGAMIVAPLMTPILGSALALVLADQARLRRSIGLVVGGALVVIAIAMVMGAFVPSVNDFAGNGQVEARISPRLIDLVAALATGTVGAFALVRADISDALPGVAIAISLVPPLAVVGLLLGVGRWSDAAGAALLFGTNVAAIIATGTAVFLAYRVRRAARRVGVAIGQLRGRALAIVVIAVAVLMVPLAAGTAEVAANQRLIATARPIAEQWALASMWEVVALTGQDGQTVVVSAVGQAPGPDPATLRGLLDEAGLAGADLKVAGLLGSDTLCPAGTDSCSVIAGAATPPAS